MTDIDKKDENKPDYPSDCDNLEFKVEKINFFPEDVEKMKTMNIDEEIAYMRKLKAEQRYTIEYVDEE